MTPSAGQKKDIDSATHTNITPRMTDFVCFLISIQLQNITDNITNTDNETHLITTG